MNREALVQFVKELKEKFEWDKLILTSSLETKEIIHTMLDIDRFGFISMSKYLDHMQIPSSMRFRLIGLGVPSQKLIINLPMYGRLQTTTVEVDRDSSYSEKSVTYSEICDYLQQWGFPKMEHSNDTDMKIVTSSSGNKNFVLRYQGTRTIAMLVKTAMNTQLGGVMVGIVGDEQPSICQIDKDTYDDFKFTKSQSEPADNSIIYSKSYSTKFTLVNVVNRAIIAALEEISQWNESKIHEAVELTVDEAKELRNEQTTESKIDGEIKYEIDERKPNDQKHVMADESITHAIFKF